MISKFSTLILGTLAESKKNPYEITKMLEALELRKWFSIADSTVYATVNSLSKKGLITGEKIKESNFPAKTVYSITAEGEFELHQSISNYFEKSDPTTSEFDIAILFMHNLGKEELLKIFKSKLESLESASYMIKRRLVNLENKRDKQTTGIILLKHRMYFIEAESKTIKELVRHVNLGGNISPEQPLDLRLN